MFALGVHYLNGWSMAAADGAQKEQAEWPPHPDRVFMALAAAWFETGQNEEEGAALRWIEGLTPPAIAASDCCERTSVVSYVPVNDDGHRKLSNPKKALDRLKKQGLARLPEYRMRRGRRFPVAVPHDPTIRLIWPESLDEHGDALRRLTARVTHIGHSASFVQAWIEDEPSIEATWLPTDGVADRHLRLPFVGRLALLADLANRDQWVAYHDLRDAFNQAKADLKTMKRPPRAAWRNFPDAVLLAPERKTRSHPHYAAAKSGDAVAAARLVDALVDEAGLADVRRLLSGRRDDQPALVSAHAYEREGYNAIPSALARLMSDHLGIPYDTDVVQTNIVGHTGAGGYGRLARQAAFDGGVEPGRAYIVVDDFIGQGGTLANLRGWVEKQRGTVIYAVGLTGKPYSAKLSPTQEQLDELRERHGRDFEGWWREQFGHTFDCLTQSEARYLARSPDVDTIRNRLAAAVREGDSRGHGASPGEQRQHIKKLTTLLEERFPTGAPRAPMRPLPGKWQGYARTQLPRSDAIADTNHRSIFDPQLVILRIQGRRVPLTATLMLTAALRGLLMRKCAVQPPPEWYSGHDASGRPTTEPHLALTPLPFVGAEHADGRVMGMALILPRALLPHEARGVLGSILHRADTGLPQEHRLFDGDRLDCALELDMRVRPPINLQPSTWTRASHKWASVTPVVLNRHFDGADKWKRAAESVKDACSHIGLPRPGEVLLHPVSLVEGVPHSRDFPQLTRKRDGGRQMHTHAEMVFEEPVAGPVLIGAGRFRGYGLCRPMDEDRQQDAQPR